MVTNVKMRNQLHRSAHYLMRSNGPPLQALLSDAVVHGKLGCALQEFENANDLQQDCSEIKSK